MIKTVTCKMVMLLASPSGSVSEEITVHCNVRAHRQHDYLTERLVDCTEAAGWLEQDKDLVRPLVFWDNVKGGSCE